MDAHKPTYELRVRNVSLHRRGQTETGTLYVHRHHLIFSYQPGAASQAKQSVSRQQHSDLSGESHESETKAQGANENAAPQDVSAAAGRVQQQQRQRAKEVYVPYPLIHRCVLRPSAAHSAIRQHVNSEQVDHTQGFADDREAFPPTIGTGGYGRPSTDLSTAPYLASPKRPASPMVIDGPIENTRPPALRLKCKDFNVMAFHFHSGTSDKSADDHARQVFYSLRDRCCVRSMDEMYAAQFQPPGEEIATGGQKYDVLAEFARMGISADAAADSVGRVWRVTDINAGYEYSYTYPQILAVPRAVSDNILKYCGSFRSKARIPALAYLHPNGGSITRSSQPLVGVQGKRNPQDEKLVSAIFCSHTRKASPGETPPNDERNMAYSPPMVFSDSNSTVGVEIDANHAVMNENLTKPRVYGSTRRNLIVDARPKINMIANKAAGGGIEDVANYSSPASDVPVEKVFLNIANIHSMRSSLEKVVDALGNADYIDLAPNQEALRKSGWLGHIAGILDGAEMVARVVGLGASHALIHCSDGWDRTSQISALAQVMLDPHYRTLQGFITLIQKDFLSFGHKFRHRQGTEGSEKWFEIENERVQPSRAYQNGRPADSNQLHVLSSRALSGARSWFDKNRSNLFGQPQTQSSSPESLSRPRTPPSNTILHSTPSPAVAKEEKHKMDEKEVAPIFHQFLDAVYQLTHQEPEAFEFNERFLRRLFYHSYSGQYGEFLYNCEKERSAKGDKLPSVWAYFLARKQEFTNPQYATIAGGGLIFPRRHGYEREVEARWWASLFGRKDEEMNVPRSQLPPDMSSLAAHASSLSLDDNSALSPSTNVSTEVGAPAAIRSAKSTPALYRNAFEAGSAASVISFDGIADDVPSTHARPEPSGRDMQITDPIGQAHNDTQLWSKHDPEAAYTPTKQSKHRQPGTVLATAAEAQNSGLKKTAPAAANDGRAGGLDFAAFAQQNAFSER